MNSRHDRPHPPTRKLPDYKGRLAKMRPADPFVEQDLPPEYDYGDASGGVRKILEALVGEPIRESHKRRKQRDAEDLELLLDHYGIHRDSPNHWRALALQLARAHVRGFQYERGRRGAPTKWGYMENAKLLAKIQDILEKNPAQTASGACEALTKKNGPYKQFSAKGLYNRYLEARKAFAAPIFEPQEAPPEK